MENKSELVFIDGLNFQSVPPTAPETVRGKLYFQWSKFKEFAEKNVNERGYLNVQMMKSKNTGGIYFILDTFVAIPSKEAQEYNENKYKHPDPNVQSANEKSAERLFNQPLSEEEQFNLSQMSF